MVNEVNYRDVSGYPGYRVGDDGSVWSCRSTNGRGPLKSVWRQLSPRYSKKDYGQVLLYSGGARVMLLVHRIVLESFGGIFPVGYQACHNDGNRRNNSLANLRWDTPKNNHADRVLHGTSGRGETNGSAKLDTEGVKSIRRRVAAGEKYVTIAKTFGLTPEAVSLAARGVTWGHISEG